MNIEDELRKADAMGVAPPQNWTTRAADEIASLRKDAERYRWLRDLLAVEDIHEALMNRIGFDEAESLKCDAAVDECMAHDARRPGAA